MCCAAFTFFANNDDRNSDWFTSATWLEWSRLSCQIGPKNVSNGWPLVIFHASEHLAIHSPMIDIEVNCAFPRRKEDSDGVEGANRRNALNDRREKERERLCEPRKRLGRPKTSQGPYEPFIESRRSTTWLPSLPVPLVYPQLEHTHHPFSFTL